jgi:quinol monooxygenase YgiN
MSDDLTSPTRPVVAIADLFALSGRRSELVALLKQSEKDAAAQPGCRRYTFSASLADPDQFALISEWDSQQALDQHYRSDAFARFQLALGGLLARPSHLTIYAVASSVHPTSGGPMDPRDAD